MSFAVRTEAAEGAVEIWVLEGNGARAEVCSQLGFNCFRWRDGARELLYRDAAFFSDGRPTRSGVPVLFPFPNRIRDGRFTWDGRAYELPRNDSTGANAIHGFACRSAWRVVEGGADDRSAWVTGEFHCAQDSPQSLPLWPADHRIRLTVRLGSGLLRFEAEVDNPDRVPLPFGLGYHPYFLLPGDPPDAPVQARVYGYWPLVDSLPSGPMVPELDPARDLTAARPFRELHLDDVLVGIGEDGWSWGDALVYRGRVGDVGLSTSARFRELVVFTPPHRKAMCLEPYTCTTDAINLQQRGIDAGLMVLGPGERWAGVMEFRLGNVGTIA